MFEHIDLSKEEEKEQGKNIIAIKKTPLYDWKNYAIEQGRQTTSRKRLTLTFLRYNLS